MPKFEEIMAQMRGQMQDLLNENNVDKIAQGVKTLDALEAEYKTAQKESQDAKENLVKYVKEYAFKDKPEDSTHTEETPSLDELFEKEFNSK